MRFFFLILLISSLIMPAISQELYFPEKQGVVTDEFEVIDSNVRARIEALADELRRITTIDLAVAIVRTTRPLDAESYGRQLYDKWAVGQYERGLDHGVLLLIDVLDRETRLIPGQGVEFLFPPLVKEKMEVDLYPLLGEGKIKEAALFGAASISDYILREWPKYHQPGHRLDFNTMSRIAFLLAVVSVLLAILFGGNPMMAVATFIGGLFGYVMLGIPGLLIGAAIGFLTNLAKVERQPSGAEKEFKEMYDKWKKKEEE